MLDFKLHHVIVNRYGMGGTLIILVLGYINFLESETGPFIWGLDSRRDSLLEIKRPGST